MTSDTPTVLNRKSVFNYAAAKRLPATHKRPNRTCAQAA